MQQMELFRSFVSFVGPFLIVTFVNHIDCLSVYKPIDYVLPRACVLNKRKKLINSLCKRKELNVIEILAGISFVKRYERITKEFPRFGVRSGFLSYYFVFFRKGPRAQTHMRVGFCGRDRRAVFQSPLASFLGKCFRF